MVALRLGSGHYTVDPNTMDQTFISAWEQIYKGNVAQQSVGSHIASFLHRYLPFCFVHSFVELSPITAQDLADTIAAITPSASGFDNIAPIDLKLLSPHCLSCLAQLLNTVEAGAPWPAQLLHAKGALLPKDTSQPFNPLAYRVLMVMSSCYRCWAATRLRHLGGWINLWRLDSMYSGLPGVGAQDAWYDMAMQVENADIRRDGATGGAVDIHKCFDQIIRPLLYWLLLLGGFPPQLLVAYANHLEALQIHFSFASHIGQGHTHPCGIPQGCPFSMVFITFLMYPWHVLLKSLHVQPRALADDLMVVTFGNRALHRFQRGFSATLTFLSHLGAQIAHTKSILFSTVATYRKWLLTKKWDVVHDVIPVLTSFRDLGAMLNTTARYSTQLSRSRLHSAIKAVHRISRLPHETLRKAMFVKACCHTKGLYDSPAAPADEKALATYTSAIVHMLSPSTWHPCHTAVFDTAPLGAELDPSAAMLSLRLVTLKRYLIKNPHRQPLVQGMLNHYHSVQFVGVYRDPHTHAALKPAPPLGHQGRQAWKGSPTPHGPLGLLLQQLHMNASAMQHVDFMLHLHHTPAVSLLHTTINNLKQAALDTVKVSRDYHGHHSREALQHCTAIDHKVFADALKLTEAVDHSKIICHVASLGSISQASLAKHYDHHEPVVCHLCGAAKPNTMHFLWECTHCSLVQARASDDALQQTIVEHHQHIPASIKLCIPNIMAASLHSPFWLSSLALPAQLPQSVAEQFGVSHHRYPTQFAEWLDEHTGLSAYQFFQSQLDHADVQAHEIPYMPPIMGPVPPKPSYYSDGTLNHPHIPALALSATAVWLPELLTHHVDLTAPTAVAQLKDRHDGRALLAKLLGPSTSSFRPELLGLLIASLIPMAIHIGIDNSGVVGRAQVIIQHHSLRPNIPFQKPLALWNDGDFWVIFNAIVLQRGPHSIWVSWVKGHAKKDYLDKHPEMLEHVGHNNTADSLADDALHLHPPSTIQLSDAYAKRYGDYVNFMHAVHTIVVRVYVAYHKLRNSPAYQLLVPKAPTSIKVVTLDAPGLDLCQPLHFKATKALFDFQFKRVSYSLQGFMRLLSRMSFMPSTNGPGVTWLELYTLSLAMCDSPLPKNKPGDRSNIIKQQLTSFMRQGIKLVQMLLTPEQAVLFRASKHAGNRLQQLGFTNRMPHTSVLIHLNVHACKLITLTLLSAHHPISIKQSKLHTCNKLHRNVGVFLQRGTFKWRKTMHDLHAHMLDCYHVDLSVFATAHSLASSPGLAFTCPNGHSRLAVQPTFSPAKPSKAVWCSTCHRSHGGKKWICACGVPWSSCSLHFTAVPVGLVKQRRKRAAAQVTPASEEESNRKLTRLEADHWPQQLVFKPGPLLQAKLAKLNASNLSSTGDTAPLMST